MIFDEQMGERDRAVEVDHRSARSCASSSKSTLSVVTGARAGTPGPGSRGGVGPIEAMLVDRIAVAYWRLRRATRAEVGELIVEFDKDAGYGAVQHFSGVAEILRKQVEAADPNSDFGTWLQNEGVLADLGWDPKEVAAHINNLRSDERKPWLLQALEEKKQECLQCERAQLEQIDRHHQALLVQRSLPGSSEAVANILRYETTIDRQLYRAITELEKLQAARRRTSSPDSDPTRAG